MKRFIFAMLPLSLLAVPAQILLIRHAETTPDSHALSLKGRERASALEPFFQGNPSTLFYGLPTAIFALETTQDTVAPISKALNVSVTTSFSTVQEISKEVLTNPDYEGKMVLICLPQEDIVDLTKTLGVKKAPKKWLKNSYDRLWTLTFDDQEKVVFNDLPQKLLYGDSDK